MDPHDRATLAFYDKEARAYGQRGDRLGAHKQLEEFVTALPARATVLDLGCGAGRDTQALIDAGCDVTAIDGSAEMAREAEKRIARPVRVALFEDLDYVASFDGVWASASLLHVPRAGLGLVLSLVYRALKPNGLLFASFKSGGKEGRDKLGRYYNYVDPHELEAFLNAAGRWASIEFRTGKGEGYDGVETAFVACLARKCGQ